MARYAVLRIAKVKTMGHVAGLGTHVERERETRNADAERRAQNERLAGTGDWCADVERRLAEAPLIRKNAVLAIEHVMTASPEFFAAGDERRVAAWRDASMAWLRETYGERNVVAAVLHRDELTPHIQALVVPIDDHGRLNARDFIGGERGRLSALQDSYHEAVGRLGLERGVRGSVAAHQTVKEYYTKISEPTPARGAVLRDVEIERPGRIVTNPERWAEEQREKVVEQVTPAVDAALTKARHYEGQAAKAEANVVALQERVRALEQAQERLTRDYRALAERVRDIPLPDALKALGASQDRSDAHKWHTEAGVLNVTGAKFYNHTEGRGGGGAIDVVMHVAGYDVKGATSYLADRFGADAAAGAAVAHQTPAFRRWAERAEPPAFEPPQEDAGRWEQVRAYLVEERRLSARFVDALHEGGFVYADRRGNAVFPRCDAEGEVVGAALRGTDPESVFKGLAAGSRREEGHWAYSSGLKEYLDKRPTLLLAESPIDAISAHLLHYRSEPVRVVSTDGAGALPAREIAEAREKGWAIRGAFDHDPAGERLYGQLTQACRGADVGRERPRGKDWNEDLQERAEQRAQERDRSSAPSRSRAQSPVRGGWDHDR